MISTHVHDVQLIELDWNPELEMGANWRKAGANLREAIPALGQHRSVELDLNLTTGYIVAKVGKRNPMGKIASARYYALSLQHLTAIFLDHDAAEQRKKLRL